MANLFFRPSSVPFAALLSLIAAAPARAQEDETSGFRLRFDGGYVASTTFDKAPNAELTTYRAGVGLRYDRAAADGSELIVGFGSQFARYAFTPLGGVGAVAPAPYQYVNFTSLYGSYRRPVAEDTEILAVLRGMSGMDQGADPGDSLALAAIGGVSGRVSEDLDLGIAIGYQTWLENRAILYPIPLLDWRLDERWRLHSDAVTDDPSGFGDLAGLRLSYLVDEAQSCHFGLAWQMLQYRLDNDASDPLPQAGVMDHRWAVYAGTSWRAQHNLVLTLDLGYYLRQETIVANPLGPDPPDRQTDPAPFAVFGVEFRF